VAALVIGIGILLVWGLAEHAQAGRVPDDNGLSDPGLPGSPVTVQQAPARIPAPSLDIVVDPVTLILAPAEYILQAEARQEQRITNEGQWAGQIVTWLKKVPRPAYLEYTREEFAKMIVKTWGFGGSWRIGIAHPVEGMKFVLNKKKWLYLPTYNLLSINVAYNRRLKRAEEDAAAAAKAAPAIPEGNVL